MTEIWKSTGIKSYEVSNLGRVRNTLHNKTYLLKTNTNNSKGYERVEFRGNNNERVHASVHRLVALAFIPNPDNKPEVHHIDEIKTNNVYTNLQWVTGSENVRHSIQTWINKAHKRPVKQLTLDGQFIKQFISLRDVEKTLGYKTECICRCANGITKKSYGYKWSYD